MIQEQKDLLLKDLCARLSYSVKGLVTFNGNPFMTQHHIEDRTIDGELYDRFAKFQDSWYDNVTIKPYLFPLSSMTEEQKKEYDSIIYHNVELHWEKYYDVIDVDWYEELHDFYNKNHLDYRGLIPMGLANDATGLNIY